MAGPAPVSVTLTPYRFDSTAHRASFPVTVSSKSAGDVTVSPRFESVISGQGGGCLTEKAPSWLHTVPGQFTLAPGQAKQVHVIVSAPAGVTGNYDLLAIFSAAPAGQSGQGLHVAGGVAARVLLSYGGHTSAAPCVVAHPRPVAVHQGPAGGLPVGDIAGLALAAAVALAGAIGAFRLWRRGRHGGHAAGGSQHALTGPPPSGGATLWEQPPAQPYEHHRPTQPGRHAWQGPQPTRPPQPAPWGRMGPPPRQEPPYGQQPPADGWDDEKWFRPGPAAEPSGQRRG